MLALKDAELRACCPRGPQSCDDVSCLREEHQALQAELLKQEQTGKRGAQAVGRVKEYDIICRNDSNN